jgi:hypothetical protein
MVHHKNYFQLLQVTTTSHEMTATVTSTISHKITVPDLGSRIRNVVLVRRICSTGKPHGVGILEWGGDGEWMEVGRSVYEQPGTKVTGSYHTKEGFQVSKRKLLENCPPKQLSTIQLLTNTMPTILTFISPSKNNRCNC